jgi:hypothetical protein
LGDLFLSNNFIERIFFHSSDKINALTVHLPNIA